MGQVKTNLVREALYDRIGDRVEDFAEKRPAAPGGNRQSVTMVAADPRMASNRRTVTSIPSADNKPVKGNLEFGTD